MPRSRSFCWDGVGTQRADPSDTFGHGVVIFLEIFSDLLPSFEGEFLGSTARMAHRRRCGGSAIPPAVKCDTFHRNPKRKRGIALRPRLRPRLRFGLRSIRTAGGRRRLSVPSGDQRTSGSLETGGRRFRRGQRPAPNVGRPFPAACPLEFRRSARPETNASIGSSIIQTAIEAGM